MMLENLRFDPGEEAERSRVRDEPRRELGDVYVNDAFGAAHRAHASIVGPPRVLPSAGGPAARARGRGARRRCSTTPKHPFVAVLGGVKVSDKLGVIDALLERCDTILIGGAMAFTFLVAQGARVGDSLVEPDQVEHCQRLLATGRDRDPDRRRRRAGDDADATTRHVRRDAHPRRLEGPRHRARDRGHLRRRDRRRGDGVVERADGRVRARAVRGRHAHGRRGGRRLPRLHGRSAAATARPRSAQFGLADRIDHVSTGGGASLELIELGDLPGLQALAQGSEGNA